MVVTEVEEVSGLLFLFDYDGKDLSCIQLCWGVEVNLAQQTGKRVNWSRISRKLLLKRVNLYQGEASELRRLT